LAQARRAKSEQSMGNNKTKEMPMTLHRCIRVFSLAALLLIVPAGVFL
jgi:hypothetical protein